MTGTQTFGLSFQFLWREIHKARQTEIEKRRKSDR